MKKNEEKKTSKINTELNSVLRDRKSASGKIRYALNFTDCVMNVLTCNLAY